MALPHKSEARAMSKLQALHMGVHNTLIIPTVDLIPKSKKKTELQSSCFFCQSPHLLLLLKGLDMTFVVARLINPKIHSFLLLKPYQPLE